MLDNIIKSPTKNNAEKKVLQICDPEPLPFRAVLLILH